MGTVNTHTFNPRGICSVRITTPSYKLVTLIDCKLMYDSAEEFARQAGFGPCILAAVSARSISNVLVEMSTYLRKRRMFLCLRDVHAYSPVVVSKCP